MQGFIRILVWSAAFVGAIVLLLFVFGAWVAQSAPALGRGVSNAIGMGLPGLVALWILFLGFRHATSRAAVLACAIASGLLIAAQAFIVTILMLYSRGFGASRAESDALAVLLGVVLLAGGFVVWRFVNRRWPRKADAT